MRNITERRAKAEQARFNQERRVAMDSRILELHDQGLSAMQIARRLGKHDETVRIRLRKLGVEPRRQSEVA